MSSRYSATVMEHFLEPRHRGAFEQPAGVGVSGVPGQGPFFIFQVCCRDGRVREARFQCHNCGVTVASGSILTEMVEGQTLRECQAIDEESLAAALDGVPPDKRHMLHFVLSALNDAVTEAME
ncbi:MAG: iron-sulfur cluster assembly scaffold protein [Candidatus Paceibacterota bacterium]